MNTSFTFSKAKWNRLKDKKLLETPIFSIHQIDAAADGEGRGHPFYVLDTPDWVNVIALTSDNSIVLVEQYRVGIDESTLEIPGGIIDKGEKPLEAAKRELTEETGYMSEKWEMIGTASSNPAIFSNRTYLFLAKECKKTGPQETDLTEDIAIHTLELSRFLQLVKNGTVHHAIVLAAVAQFLLHREETT